MLNLSSIFNKRIRRIKSSLRHEAIRELRNSYLIAAVSLLPLVFGAYLSFVAPVYNHIGFIGSVLLLFLGFYVFSNRMYRYRVSGYCVVWAMLFTLWLGYLIAPLIAEVVGEFGAFEVIMVTFGGISSLLLLLSAFVHLTKINFMKKKLPVTLLAGGVLLYLAFYLNQFFLEMPLGFLVISLIVLFSLGGYILHQTHATLKRGEVNYVVAGLAFYFVVMGRVWEYLKALFKSRG